MQGASWSVSRNVCRARSALQVPYEYTHPKVHVSYTPISNSWLHVYPSRVGFVGSILWASRSGGALPVVVTLFGWATAIKCLLVLFLSPEAESRLFLEGLRYEQLFYFYYAFSTLLGIYMVYAAGRPQTRQAT